MRHDDPSVRLAVRIFIAGVQKPLAAFLFEKKRLVMQEKHEQRARRRGSKVGYAKMIFFSHAGIFILRPAAMHPRDRTGIQSYAAEA